MEKRRLKFVLLGVGVVLTMGAILAVGLRGSGGMVYYLSVTEFMEQADRDTRGYRINGKVIEGTITRAADGNSVSFTMSDGISTLDVAYAGIIPDTFVDRADVVVEGTLLASGVFESHTLLAKCPSKYEAADDFEAPYEEES
jgi:cytochrome c-type biogenesis protein CcmE